MDPLSVNASIIAIVQLTSVIIGCLNDLKGTTNDRARCAMEISNVSNLLVTLMYRLDEVSSNDGWYAEVQALAAASGPIDQYRSALEQLKSKFMSTASSGLKISNALSWKFSKEEVANILMRIERLKSLTQIALEMDHFKLSQALKMDTTVITSTVRSLQENQVSEQYRVITDWLSSTDFSAEQSDFIGRRREGTGQWFIKSPEFTSWLQGTKQDLFCRGMPGAGKTMIAAIAVDHMWEAFKDDNVGVAYLYCNYKRRETQTTMNLLASILKQLVQERPLYGEPVTTLHKQHAKRRTRPLLKEICDSLKSVLRNYSKTYIVVDALDECTDSDGTRSELITTLRSLQSTTNTRLMVTSRFDVITEQSFQDPLMLEIRASETDVKRYVAGQLHRLPMCVQRDHELQKDIQDGISQAVDGMFLLAQLHLDSLGGKTRKKAIRSSLKTLKTLPKGSTALNKAYDEVIERIENQSSDKSELARNVLYWITSAIRQLTTTELSHALAVEEGESELDEDNIPDIEDIISVCAGLVTVDEESNVIRLVHYTTQEYFEHVRKDWIPRDQEGITSTCLTYLSFKTFNTGHCNNDADFESRLRQNPFLDYAARYWGNHALPVQQAIKELALQFLSNMRQLACSSQVMLVPHYRNRGYSQAMTKELTGIHLAVVFKLTCLLQELTRCDGNENCMNINARDSNGKTPLSWAAEEGHEAVVKLLLQRDDVAADLRDRSDQTPLSWAAKKGHEAVVKLLLQRDDVAANSRDKWDQTPLSWAAEEGQEEVVKLLLQRDDVAADPRDKWDQTPLSRAAEQGKEAVVKLLLKRDDIIADSKDDKGQTPLSKAASMGQEAVLGLLLKRDDVIADSKDDNGRTPLSWAAEGACEATVKLLLGRNDVNANSEDKDGCTPLWWAANSSASVEDSRQEAVVTLLLERDIIPDLKNKDGRTPLSRAAGRAHKAIVKLLLERDDVDPNSEDKDGHTPLWWAAEGNEIRVSVVDLRPKIIENGKELILTQKERIKKRREIIANERKETVMNLLANEIAKRKEAS